jgi:hypothetical protein
LSLKVRSVGGHFAVARRFARGYFTAEDHGKENIYSARLTGGTAERLPPPIAAHSPTSRFPQGRRSFRLYANWESASVPGEIAAVNPKAARLSCSPSSMRRARRNSICRH